MELISSGKLNIVNNLKKQFNYSTIQETFATQVPVDNPLEAKNLSELNQLSALFPSPDRIFGRPETQAQKYIALKRIAKKQFVRNLEALTEGVMDETVSRNLESKNVELERLLDLLAGVPDDLPGGLDENVLNDLKNALKSNK